MEYPDNISRQKDLLVLDITKKHPPFTETFTDASLRNCYTNSDFEFNQYVTCCPAGFNILLKLEFRNHVRMITPISFLCVDRTAALTEAWWMRFSDYKQAEQAMEYLPVVTMKLSSMVGFIRDFVDFLCFKLRYKVAVRAVRASESHWVDRDREIRMANAELLRLSSSYQTWLDEILKGGVVGSFSQPESNMDARDPAVALSRFLAANFVIDPRGQVAFSSIYSSLCKYLDDHGLPPMSRKALGGRLNKRFPRFKNSEVYYRGLSPVTTTREAQ